MARQPLFKTVAPPLTETQRLRMVQQARRALTEREQLTPVLKSRGIAALQSAEERLRRRMHASSPQGAGS